MEKMKMNKDLIFIHKNFRTKEEVIANACDHAEKAGYVTADFKADLIKREQTFPTGLGTAVPLAIPHVGTSCTTSFMSLTTVSQPVDFEYMDGTEGKAPIEIVFVFGIVQPEDQVKVLQKLSALFQDAECLNRIKTAQDPEEGFSIISSYLGDLTETDQ